jgi:hypothetical protein
VLVLKPRLSKARADLLLMGPLNEENLKAFGEFQRLLQLKVTAPIRYVPTAMSLKASCVF